MLRFFALLPFFFLLYFGCNTAALPLHEQGELQGKVRVIGNDPFTKVALALDDRTSIVLLCSPEVDTFLRNHQGEQAKVTYAGTSQVPEGQAVRVTAAGLVRE